MEAELISIDEAHRVEVADYAPKVRPDVARRIAHMAGVGKGVELDPKPYFKLGTSLTTSPQFHAYQMKPRFTPEEAKAIARAKYGV